MTIKAVRRNGMRVKVHLPRLTLADIKEIVSYGNWLESPDSQPRSPRFGMWLKATVRHEIRRRVKLEAGRAIEPLTPNILMWEGKDLALALRYSDVATYALKKPGAGMFIDAVHKQIVVLACNRLTNP